MWGWNMVVMALMAFINSSNSQYKTLSGHQIWHLEGEIGHVPQKLLEEGLVDVLDLSGSLRKIRVNPKDAETVRQTLLQEGIPYSVLVEDLATHLEAKEFKRSVKQTQTCTATSCSQPLTDAYMTLEQIEWYLKELNATYPWRVSVTSIGESVEGRDIWQVQIKTSRCAMADAAVWLEGGLHAREWISPAVTLQLIDRLVKQCTISKIFDVYVVPMANPDGYLYSWTDNRLWRKNRRNNPNSDCDGVDLNRNWDYQYGVGASNNPCSEVFKGSAAFSEPETLSLKNAMQKVDNEKNLVMVMALHSFGQVLLYPYGWTTDPAPDTPDMIEKGKVFADAAKNSFGTTFNPINSGSGFSLASGATDDWAKGVLQVKYSYTLELRDEGVEGFTLGADKIAASGQETWEGLMALLFAIKP